MTKDKLAKLLDQVQELDEAELSEFQRLVAHLLGLKRSMSVLSGALERPGKRGKRWAKKAGTNP